MKLLAINGSPRKYNNTAQLLGQVIAGARSAGAEAEHIYLRELKYTGCISCFACKKIQGPSYGRCIIKDDLQPVLQKAHEADVLVLGTPFYFFTESAFMRAFEERLWYQYLIYSKVKPPLAPKKKATALIFTMNCREDQIEEYGMHTIISRAKWLMEREFAPCEIFLSCDTLQFDDYSQYDNDLWDVPAKQKRHKEIFPQELKQAYELGVRLAT